MSTSTRLARRSSAASGAPMRRGRRRAMWTRLAPLAAAAVVGVHRRRGDRGRRRRPAPDHGARVRRGLGARRLRGDARAADAGGAAPRPARALRRRLPQRRQGGDALRPQRGPAGKPRDGTSSVPVRAAHAHLRHALRPQSRCPSSRSRTAPRSTGAPYLVHPGLRRGEKLSRTTTLPPRAAIQARDGKPLAEGEDRRLRARRAGRRRRRPHRAGAARARRRARPPRRAAGCTVGLTGLEREFDAELTGRPAGAARRRPRDRLGRATARQRGAHDDRPRRSSARPSRRSRGASAGSP